ncbi:PREDICTED: UDP-glucuronosyltransferase 2B33 [Bactrocera latifrons]|uniref:UDP-glucuronosyltransferase 2B33 n=1 Tax=Bactrocera latifrons TaxID=174628 RepID=UPI0008DE7477|nr:PREDICTED: UDP-glucuronosyltransferase 2B33 [Bactrocera latifrons]
MKFTNFAIALLVTLCHALNGAESANILSLVEVLAPDQQIWHDAVIRGLIESGHKVTLVSGSTMHSKSPHLTQIHLEQVKEALDTTINRHSRLVNAWLNPFERIYHWYNKQMKVCQAVLSSTGLHELIALSRGSGMEAPFDVIIFDATYGHSCLLALTQLFEHVPIVAVSASHITPDLLQVVPGTQLQPAIVPHFTSTHDEHMNFFARLHNTLVYAAAQFFRQFTVLRVQEALLARHEALQAAHVKPTFESVHDRVKVALVNSHPAFDYVHSLPPNVIQVAGLQFDNINRPLLVEMQTFIDDSIEGVFVITIGAELLTPVLIEQVLSVVDKFPEFGFVWGVKKIMIPSTGRKNLYVGKWLKKSNILAQNKVIGVITSGSHMEVQEAIYHGVPIIAVTNTLQPPSIATRVQSLGIGLRVDLKSGAEKLQSAISALATKPQFTENVKSRQVAFRNRPQNPLEEALWWIEHVMEHPKESDCLHSQAVVETSFFALHSLDAMSVLLFMLVMFLVNTFIVLKQLREQCQAKGKKTAMNGVDKEKILKRKTKKTNNNKKKVQ